MNENAMSNSENERPAARGDGDRLLTGSGLQGMERLVDSKTVMAFLGVSRRTVQRLTGSGAIPSHRIGRLVRFRLSEIENWIRAGCPDGRPNRSRSPRAAPATRFGKEVNTNDDREA